MHFHWKEFIYSWNRSTFLVPFQIGTIVNIVLLAAEMKISGGMLIGLTKGLANYLLELRILFDFVIEKFLFVSKTLLGINFYDNFERDITRMVLKTHSRPENLKKSRQKNSGFKKALDFCNNSIPLLISNQM